MSAEPPDESELETVDLAPVVPLRGGPGQTGAGGLPVFGGRYRAIGELGRGGFGTVWRAVDEPTGAEVAVKVQLRATTNDAERARREVAALGMVPFPGVVRLLDHGQQDGALYIVMEIAPGTPFPGRITPARWEVLAPAVIGVLQALRGVHAQGIVHRDLKPANVMVDGARVTLLDFGIARGEPLGHTITARHLLVGSPAYLAPEQLGDRRKDARTDLYAVGVMMFEALAGRLPFEAGNLAEVIATRTSRDAPPLRAHAPSVPEGVCAVVDRLLRREPDERYPSAEAVLDALGAPSLTRALPWLGGDATVAALVARARTGRPIDLGGAPGSGRSRTLREAVARLKAEGRVVWVVGPGVRGLESLRPLIGDLAGEDIRAEAERMVRERLAAGDVVVVDDLGRVDWHSRDLIERVREGGAVVKVVDGPGDLRPEPLREVDLRVLFHGPELVHHLPEDGARALSRRTAALPARIVAEVDAWVFAGLARWDGDKLRTSRASLERIELGVTPRPPVASAPALDGELARLLAWILLAGPGVDAAMLARATERERWEVRDEVDALCRLGAVRERGDGALEAVLAPAAFGAWSTEERIDVHLRLARALEPGAAGRLAHFAGAKDVVAMADEALVLAGRLIPDGRVGTAAALLELALQALRGLGEADRERALARELTRAALREGSVPALRRVRYVMAPVDARYAALVEAWALAQGGKLEAADAVRIAPIDDEELDGYRHALRVRVLAQADAAAAEAYLDGVPAEPGGARARRKREWLGQVRFLASRYAEAAELHAAVAAEEPGVYRRCAALINTGLALREAYDYEGALERFEEALGLAVDDRLAGLEAWARHGIRTIQYRLDRAEVPDLALVEAVEPLGIGSISAQVLLTEAIVAWRSEDLDVGRDLALRACRAFEGAGRIGRAYATAVAAACGAEVEIDWLFGPDLAALPLVAFEIGVVLADRDPQARTTARVALGALPDLPLQVRLVMVSRGEWVDPTVSLVDRRSR